VTQGDGAPLVVETPDGRSLGVEISGHPAGRAVFLLHGTLYRRGIRLISFNRPGYPGSQRIKGRRVADAAADVEAIADHFDIDKFSVIGRSGGAPHALACAAAESLRGRLVCTAALSRLAPYGAEGLDWYEGMAESNVEAFHNAERNLQKLIATLNQHADQVRHNSQGLLNALWPELGGSDRQVIGDIALRQIIARTHADALRDSVDGWVDDVLALGRPWGFELSDIKAPVLLWHGASDMYSPVGHAQWLDKRIHSSDLREQDDAAHFASVEILPDILSWVLGQVDAVAPVSSRP
jgi:pimeloyl-ACP methyl ester carboxylesterase